MKEMPRDRKAILQLLIVLLWVALGFLLAYTGKKHTMVFVNEDIKYKGQTYKAFDSVLLHAGGDERKIEWDDRILVDVVGLRGPFSVTLPPDADHPEGRQLERTLNFRFERRVFVSIPLLMAGKTENDAFVFRRN
jgi:hypothetical protein